MNPNSDKPVIPLCRHIKTNGLRCKSPALSGGRFCYFHQRLRHAHRPPPVIEAMSSYWQEHQLIGPEGEDFRNIDRVYPRQNKLRFPPLEDAESIQLATSMLFQAIATGQIHFKRARILIYALKIACINQHSLRIAREEDQASPVATTTSPIAEPSQDKGLSALS